MKLFDKLREPVVLKENSDAKRQLEQLDTYLKTAPESIKKQIELDKKYVYYGIKGEESLMFELKNSHMPMYILHDIFLKENGLTTQIDYIVITRKVVLIIECKNLYGNISVDNQGNFTRKFQLEDSFREEGIYSPITQNQRHLDMIREKRRNSRSFITRTFFDKHFNDNYKSVVVIANPKAIINIDNAPNEVKSKIVKVDMLNSYIKRLNDESNNKAMNDEQMKELANFFLKISVPNSKNYTEKYEEMKTRTVTVKAKKETSRISADTIVRESKPKADISKTIGRCPNCGADVLKGKFGWYCKGKCGIYVAKVYNRDAKINSELSDGQIKELLNGKSIVYVDGYKKVRVLPELVKNSHDDKTYYNWKTETIK